MSDEQATRVVICTTTTCGNFAEPLDVPDNGMRVICGVCNEILAERDPAKETPYEYLGPPPVILQSPDSTSWLLDVDDDGQPRTTPLPPTDSP